MIIWTLIWFYSWEELRFWILCLSYTYYNLYQLNFIYKKYEDISFHGKSLIVNKFKSEVNILI